MIAENGIIRVTIPFEVIKKIENRKKHKEYLRCNRRIEAQIGKPR